VPDPSIAAGPSESTVFCQSSFPVWESQTRTLSSKLAVRTYWLFGPPKPATLTHVFDSEQFFVCFPTRSTTGLASPFTA